MLKQKTVKELRDLAKELNIIGRWDMKKSELIEAIETALENSPEYNDDKDELEFEKVKVEKSNEQDSYIEIVSEIVTKGKEIHDNMERTTYKKKKRTAIDYLANKEIGLTVAVEHEGKYYSAKIISYPNDSQVEIETRHKSRFIVNNEDVKWVKTGQRWPKFIFDSFNREKSKKAE